MDDYNVIFLGYPIWHGQAPRIISTFLEAYDFSGKTIISFCTSHSSGIGSSDTNLHSLASEATWEVGKRFAGDTDSKTVAEWVETFDFQAQAREFNFETKTVMLNSGYEMPLMGLGTYSLSDEVCYNSVTALLDNGGRQSRQRKQCSARGNICHHKALPESVCKCGGRGHTGEMLGNETISAIGEAHGVTSAQVILRWNLQNGVVVIPGSSNPEHIKETLDIFGFELTQEEMNRINALDRNEKHDWY